MEEFFSNDRQISPEEQSTDWDVLSLWGATRVLGDPAQRADQKQIARLSVRERDRIRGLLLQMGSNAFQRRETAEREIQSVFGERALPFLREALRSPSSEEMRQRLERLTGNIMGASERNWTRQRNWNVAICRDGSNRITQMAWPPFGPVPPDEDVHTRLTWNGLNQITQLHVMHPGSVTDSDRTLVFDRGIGNEGITFTRTATGYQVTRLDGGPLPPHMQSARHVSTNERGVITVVWANGTTVNMARERPRVELPRP